MRKPNLLGVTVLTPALIGSEAHAGVARPSAVVAVDGAALARLKAGMLALEPAAKLELAADRLPANTTTTTTTTHTGVQTASTTNCHTQHHNRRVHHNAITQPTAAASNISTAANPSGGAPVGSPSTAPAQTQGALTPPPPQGYKAPPQSTP